MVMHNQLFHLAIGREMTVARWATSGESLVNTIVLSMVWAANRVQRSPSQCHPATIMRRHEMCSSVQDFESLIDSLTNLCSHSTFIATVPTFVPATDEKYEQHEQ